MIVDGCQRFTRGRVRFRPAGEVINTAAYDVASIPDDTTAKAFTLAHHYERSFPAARFRFGLYRAGELVGVAVFGQPWKHVAAKAGLPFPIAEVLELSRFVLLDAVPANGESWFLGRTFDLLRSEASGLLSFSDPHPRQNAAGEVVFRGHVGTIYQATNGVYTGRGNRRTVRLLPDGSVFSDRAMTKIRKRERGWEYSVEQLVRQGAERPGSSDLRGWLAEWRAKLTRPARHPGNHRYVWALDRRQRRHLPEGQTYPRVDVPAAGNPC